MIAPPAAILPSFYVAEPSCFSRKIRHRRRSTRRHPVVSWRGRTLDGEAGVQSQFVNAFRNDVSTISYALKINTQRSCTPFRARKAGRREPAEAKDDGDNIRRWSSGHDSGPRGSDLSEAPQRYDSFVPGTERIQDDALASYKLQGIIHDKKQTRNGYASCSTALCISVMCSCERGRTSYGNGFGWLQPPRINTPLIEKARRRTK